MHQPDTHPLKLLCLDVICILHKSKYFKNSRQIWKGSELPFQIILKN